MIALQSLRGTPRAAAAVVPILPKSDIPDHPEQNLPIKVVQATAQDIKEMKKL